MPTSFAPPSLWRSLFVKQINIEQAAGCRKGGKGGEDPSSQRGAARAMLRSLEAWQPNATCNCLGSAMIFHHYHCARVYIFLEQQPNTESPILERKRRRNRKIRSRNRNRRRSWRRSLKQAPSDNLLSSLLCLRFSSRLYCSLISLRRV